MKKYKGVSVDVIEHNELTVLYDSFMRNKQYKCTITTLEKELALKGFTKNRMRFNGDRATVYYRQHIEKPEEEKLDEFDDDDDDYLPVKDSI